MQNTHFSEQLRALHASLLDIITVMNRPQRDEQVMAAAGLSLEQALFPLLISIGIYGPVGIVDVAERIGRDYTTVSRQVARLEELGLVDRRVSAQDRRVREAVLSAKGRVIVDRIDVAREQLAREAFANWEAQDLERLGVLMRRFADAMMAEPETRQ